MRVRRERLGRFDETGWIAPAPGPLEWRQLHESRVRSGEPVGDRDVVVVPMEPLDDPAEVAPNPRSVELECEVHLLEVCPTDPQQVRTVGSLDRGDSGCQRGLVPREEMTGQDVFRAVSFITGPAPSPSRRRALPRQTRSCGSPRMRH